METGSSGSRVTTIRPVRALRERQKCYSWEIQLGRLAPIFFNLAGSYFMTLPTIVSPSWEFLLDSVWRNNNRFRLNNIIDGRKLPLNGQADNDGQKNYSWAGLKSRCKIEHPTLLPGQTSTGKGLSSNDE